MQKVTICGIQKYLREGKNIYLTYERKILKKTQQCYEIYTERQFIGTASKEEVLHANDKLRKNTEPGTDMIPAESLTVHEEEPKKKLQKVMNAIWETEKLLQAWKTLVIHPIHK